MCMYITCIVARYIVSLMHVVLELLLEPSLRHCLSLVAQGLSLEVCFGSDHLHQLFSPHITTGKNDR